MPCPLPMRWSYSIILHFSLVHDDIMDNAPLRRGQPTIHVKYGANAAILSGDAMLVYAYERLVNAPANKVACALKSI